MQVSISKASEMAGVTRATFYRHIDKKGISVTKDEEGNPKIDVSELIRVYGNKIKPVSGTVSNDTALNNDEHLQTNNSKLNSQSLNAEMEILKEKIKNLEQNRETYEAERKREREQFEERVGQLQKTLDKAQENQNKTTALLEHYTKNDETDEGWQTSIKALEEKIANQEREAKEKAEKEAKQKEQLLVKVSEHELEKRDLSKANKVYAAVTFLAVLSVIALAMIQTGIVQISI